KNLLPSWSIKPLCLETSWSIKPLCLEMRLIGLPQTICGRRFTAFLRLWIAALARPLLKGHVEDFVALAAAGGIHFHRIPGFLANQGARRWGCDRDPTGLHICLAFAHDLKNPLFVGVLVDERHRRAKLNRIAGQFRNVDDFGAR